MSAKRGLSGNKKSTGQMVLFDFQFSPGSEAVLNIRCPFPLIRPTATVAAYCHAVFDIPGGDKLLSNLLRRLEEEFSDLWDLPQIRGVHRRHSAARGREAI